MGTYIYTFRKRTHNVVLDGAATPIHPFAYAHRVSSHWHNRRQAIEDRQITMAHDAFDEAEGVVERDGEFVGVPPLVFVGDKPSEGANVYRAKSGVWSDASDFPGELVGTLTKVKNRWHVKEFSQK